MNKLFLFFMSMFLFGGCAAMYGNEAQYDEGDWHLFASSKEVARIKQDKLAMEKLASSPVSVGQIQNEPGTIVLGEPARVYAGYAGLVVNMSRYAYVKIKIDGPEKKSYFLEPGSKLEDNLIPGQYLSSCERDGQIVGRPRIFHVTAQQHDFINKKVHWFCVYQD